jgi:hypothetical protein
LARLLGLGLLKTARSPDLAQYGSCLGGSPSERPAKWRSGLADLRVSSQAGPAAARSFGMTCSRSPSTQGALATLILVCREFLRRR